AVPIAERVDKQKKFLWITTAIADAVLKDRNLQYTFRPQPNGSLFGVGSVQYIASYSPDRLKKAPKDLRVAIIYEDGPYGAGVAASNEAEAKKQGMQIVLKEGYSAQAADLSSLVTKLRAARPDVLFHIGSNPVNNIAPHVSMGFNNMWILLNDVLPRAIQKHGGWSPEALAKAARETDIPEGGTMQGYGVKFLGEGQPLRGQNERAIAAVYQVIEGQFRHVWPKVIASGNPIL